MFVCKQKPAYELRISDWSSDVCSSDLYRRPRRRRPPCPVSTRERRRNGPRVGSSLSVDRRRILRLVFRRRSLGRPCLMMHHLPQPALVEEQIGCDQVGAADLLETDHRGETAVEEGARSVATDLRRSRAAENGAPASHHLVAAVERIPAGMDATDRRPAYPRSEEHTSELQSLMRISYAAFCLKKKNTIKHSELYNY